MIEQKLESLRKHLHRIETKCSTDAYTLVADIDLQDIIALNLSRAVQICVDIGAHLIASMETLPPDTMGQRFDVLAQEGVPNNVLATNLIKAVGFQNIAVHNYESIYWIIVHHIVRHHLADFIEFAKVVALKGANRFFFQDAFEMRLLFISLNE